MRKNEWIILILAIMLSVTVLRTYMFFGETDELESQIEDLQDNLFECEEKLPSESEQTRCFNPINCIRNHELLGCRRIANNWCCCPGMVIDTNLIIRTGVEYECTCTKDLYEFLELIWWD